MRRFRVPTLFDRALWSRAVWSRVSYLLPPERPPVLLLVFQELAAACTIFEAWQAALGEIDDDDILRVSIIEDDMAARPTWHVHLSLNAEAVRAAAARLGIRDLEVGDVADVWCHMPVSRLGLFQPFMDQRDIHDRYLIIPATFEGSAIAVPHLGLGKRRLTVRCARDVCEADDLDTGWGG